MRLIFIILFVLTFLFGCGNDSQNSGDPQLEKIENTEASGFVGKWKNIRREKEIVTITERGDLYIINTGETELAAEEDDDVLLFSNQGFNFKAFIDDEGMLHIDSEKYSRLND